MVEAPVEDDLTLQCAELRAQEEIARAAAAARPAAPSQRQRMIAARQERLDAEAHARRAAAAAAAAAQAAATATPCPADTNLAQFAERRREPAAGGAVGELVSDDIARERAAQQTRRRWQRVLRQSRAARSSSSERAGVHWSDKGAAAAHVDEGAALNDKYYLGSAAHASALADALRLEVPGRHALREECSVPEGPEASGRAGIGEVLRSAVPGSRRSGGAPSAGTAEYIFTACATGVVHRWAIDRQLQSDQFRVRPAACRQIRYPIMLRALRVL